MHNRRPNSFIIQEIKMTLGKQQSAQFGAAAVTVRLFAACDCNRNNSAAYCELSYEHDKPVGNGRRRL